MFVIKIRNETYVGYIAKRSDMGISTSIKDAKLYGDANEALKAADELNMVAIKHDPRTRFLATIKPYVPQGGNAY